ncbi:Alpha/Beta hydrolase protein [Lactifluus volemus]|nr:Alpha/Beta hydrolase protein [Lactifluus volemus]
MLAKRATLALLAGRVLSALASPMEPFMVQDSTAHVLTDLMCDGESASQLESAPTPEVHLDDANFVGVRKEQPTTSWEFLSQNRPSTASAISGRALRSGIWKVMPTTAYDPSKRARLASGQSRREGCEPTVRGITPADEDCLTINVVKPTDANPGSKLPVVVWIFGGGFEIGGTATYDGGSIVSRSLDLKQPVVYVSMNYRLSAFGFMPGKEVKNAKVGNLGLQDQRLALRWVQTYISEFGGDPTKVTIWGESAGAISVALHMLTNNGNQQGLFRGAIMQSGGPIPVGDIEHGQQYFDLMVEKTGCKGSSDTLNCLREVPYNTFKKAMDESPNFFAYQGLVLAWLPRVDGVFLTEPPQHSVIRGHVSNVPMITGNCDDEGTLFSVSTINISTTADLKEYLKLYMMPRAKDSEIDLLLKYYPDDQRAGSPFDTGLRNALSAQFKRTAALQGDFVFHGPRRLFLNHRATKQNSWGFVYKRTKEIPFIGSAHATDLVDSFGPGELRDYVIHFTNNLDPNGDLGLGIPWPKWDPRNPKAVIFQDSTLFPVVIGDDNYRTDPLSFVGNMSLLYPI